MVPALRVPERVKDWLVVGVVIEAVMVRAVDWRVPTVRFEWGECGGVGGVTGEADLVAVGARGGLAGREGVGAVGWWCWCRCGPFAGGVHHEEDDRFAGEGGGAGLEGAGEGEGLVEWWGWC